MFLRTYNTNNQMCYKRDSFKNKWLENSEWVFNSVTPEIVLTEELKNGLNQLFLKLWDLARSKLKVVIRNGIEETVPTNICINTAYLIYKLNKVLYPQVELEIYKSDFFTRFDERYRSQLEHLFNELGWKF